MSGTVTVIRMRWWGHLVSLFVLVVTGFLATLAGWAGFDLVDATDGWWRGLVLIVVAALLLLICVAMLNIMFAYRLEVGPRGIGLVGTLWSHHITWQEITRIERRINARGVGYHLVIEVDGSNLPRRDWRNFWGDGYIIPTPVGQGPRKLAAYLKRKRREALKRQEEDRPQ